MNINPFPSVKILPADIYKYSISPVKEFSKRNAGNTQNFETFKPVRASELCSKFNISFRAADFEKKLDEYSKRLEKKIKETISCSDAEINEQAFTPEYIDLIGSIFKQDNIGGIYDSGISANSALKYLSKKEQIHLKGENTAFIVDRLSLEYLKHENMEKFFNQVFIDDIKFYCLDTNKAETKTLIEEFKKLTQGRFDVKKITKPKNSAPAKYPDAAEIKEIIKVYTESKFSNTEIRKEYIDAVCRYLENNLLVFSYASLTEKLKEQYKNIEQYALSQKKTMDDIVYVVPHRNKSYDLVNYLYAQTNNIPQNKFTVPEDIENGFNSGKIYVLLDDVCANGGSASADISIMKQCTNNIVFAPVAAFRKGRDCIDTLIKDIEDSTRVKMLSCIDYLDLGFIEDYFHFSHKFPSYRTILKEYLNGYKNFSIDDALMILENTRGGCGNTHSFVNFPYMIPDNSSEMNALFGSFVLNRDTMEANKAVCCTDEEFAGRRIEKQRYIALKKAVQTALSNYHKSQEQ